jgi:peptide/nickel transport system substrate-binding protein
VRARQALKLVVNRPGLAAAVYGQYGVVANDTLCAASDPMYVQLPQHEQDLEQAKSLLRQAGRSDLTVTLTSAPVGTGLPQTADVFAQQAEGAGVNAVVNQVPTAVIYGPRFLKWAFTTTSDSGDGYLVSVTESLLPNCSYSETHFTSPRLTSLYYQAVAQPNLSLRREIAGEMQRIELDRGAFWCRAIRRSSMPTRPRCTGSRPAWKALHSTLTTSRTRGARNERARRVVS